MGLSGHWIWDRLTNWIRSRSVAADGAALLSFADSTPKPNGSRRATPTSLIQRRPGQSRSVWGLMWKIERLTYRFLP
jgi:hypothetical protein